ncbi:MAG TPA: LptF/LptG family permease [Opitutaceae bacterium]|nr:LptF/LptG family permease [Opitutaceae bacterium]
MTVFDRYLLGEWLKFFGLLLAATTGLLVVFALYDNLRELLDAGARPGEMATYYAVLLPSYLSVVLPLSLLLSLLYVLGQFHRTNEIAAVRAAGLNVFQATRVLWFAALVCCGLSLVLNARVIPWSVETSRQLLEGFTLRAAQQRAGAAPLGVVTGVAFDNQRQNRMWFINRYSRLTGTAHGVTVSEMDAQRREKTRLMAREATYDAARRQWAFREGREMWLDPETGDLMRTAPFAEKVVPHFSDDPQLMLLIDRNPRDLSFFELRRIVDYFELEKNPKVLRYAVRYYGMLADTLGPLIILGIAIPFAISGVRVNPAVGVSKSIGLFFLYYILVNLAGPLGSNGLIEPMWAALMPNLTMVGLAAWFFGRMR